VSVGVEELDADKLSPLLQLKYGSLPDAVDDLGQTGEIRQVFSNFQKYLYLPLMTV
jgi:type I restriction enzyme R subunit